MTDRWALDSVLRDRGPADPQTLWLFAAAFTLPHILASFLAYADPEYRRRFGPRILRSLQVISAAGLALGVLAPRVLAMAFIVATASHVARQQTGVVRLLGRTRTAFGLWQWATVVLTIWAYAHAGGLVPLALTGRGTSTLAIATGTAFIGLSVVARPATNRAAQVWFWSTVALALSGVAFALAGYSLLSLAVPRVVHDLTAWSFYLAHDRHRFQQHGTNPVYRIGARFGLSVPITAIVVAGGLAASLQHGPLAQGALFPLMVLSFLHYDLERTAWRGDSPHRRHLVITPRLMGRLRSPG